MPESDVETRPQGRHRADRAERPVPQDALVVSEAADEPTQAPVAAVPAPRTPPTRTIPGLYLG